MLLAIPVLMMAQEEQRRWVWTKKANSRTGLYTTKNYFVSHGITLGVSAMYYFGDADNEGLAFAGGFNKNNLSYGGQFAFNYHLPAGNHCNMRFGAMVGTLNGNNKAKFDALDPPRDDYRKFNSIIIVPAVGVEYYPF